MIEFQHVHKTYGKTGKAALTDLTLTVPDGCVYGFLGPNGAGKTTAIRVMTGVLRATEGDVRVGGVSVSEDPVAVKRMIGFVPDSQDMYDRMTGWEYIGFMADIYGVGEKERREAAEKYLEMFELTGAAGQRIQGYSRGMKQKLNIIGALVHDPKIWVLDEPMVGLDPKASHLLKTEMRERADAGATVFFSTHVLEVAERLCDRVGIVSKGRLITEGTPENLLRGTNESLEDFFLELTEKEEAAEA